MACEILQWNLPALWHIEIDPEKAICKLCKNHNLDQCEEHSGQSGCSIEIGQCGCHFHTHCINKRLSIFGNINCPVHINSPWKTKKQIAN
jgi:hypothetical protein